MAQSSGFAVGLLLTLSDIIPWNIFLSAMPAFANHKSHRYRHRSCSFLQIQCFRWRSSRYSWQHWPRFSLARQHSRSNMNGSAMNGKQGSLKRTAVTMSGWIWMFLFWTFQHLFSLFPSTLSCVMSSFLPYAASCLYQLWDYCRRQKQNQNRRKAKPRLNVNHSRMELRTEAAFDVNACSLTFGHRKQSGFVN